MSYSTQHMHHFWRRFWKTEWMQEAAEEVHNRLTLGTISGPSSHEKLSIANHALHNMAGIEKNFKNTLEYMSQEAAREFQISMSTYDKTFKELCARKNDIARSLWQTKIRALQRRSL